MKLVPIAIRLSRDYIRCDRPQALMLAQRNERRLADPLNLHAVGEGNGLSVARLSAQA